MTQPWARRKRVQEAREEAERSKAAARERIRARHDRRMMRATDEEIARISTIIPTITEWRARLLVGVLGSDGTSYKHRKAL